MYYVMSEGPYNRETHGIFDTMDRAKEYVIKALSRYPDREYYIFKHVVTGKTPQVPSVFTEVTYDE